MPLRDYKCLACGLEHRDVIVKNGEELKCERCGETKVQLSFSFPSNYTIGGNNSASVRPKRMGGGK